MITAGKHTFIPSDIICYKDVNLSFGNFCSIASCLRIVSGQHSPIQYPRAVSTFAFKAVWNADYYPDKGDGFVKIGHDVWVCEDVTIIESVTIGNGVIIGAGSVVAKDIPDYAVVVGNPARIVKYRFEASIIEKLLKIAWWNWDDEKIREAVPWMKDMHDFLNKYYE